MKSAGSWFEVLFHGGEDSYKSGGSLSREVKTIWNPNPLECRPGQEKNPAYFSHCYIPVANLLADG